MSDAMATVVDEVRAACAVNTSGEVSRSTAIELERHGRLDVSLAVAPMEGSDDRWFLEISMRHDGNRFERWLQAGSRAQVIERLAQPSIVDDAVAAVKELAEAEFHTDGLPERW